MGDNHISFIVRAANSSIVPIEEGGRSGEREGNVKSCLSGVLSRQVVKAKQPGGHARGAPEGGIFAEPGGLAPIQRGADRQSKELAGYRGMRRGCGRNA